MLEIKEVEGKVNGKRGGDEGKPEALERGSGKRDRRGGLRPVKLRQDMVDDRNDQAYRQWKKQAEKKTKQRKHKREGKEDSFWRS